MLKLLMDGQEAKVDPSTNQADRWEQLLKAPLTLDGEKVVDDDGKEVNLGDVLSAGMVLYTMMKKAKSMATNMRDQITKALGGK